MAYSAVSNTDRYRYPLRLRSGGSRLRSGVVNGDFSHLSGVTNVLRHAKATAVDVVMREEDGEFLLTISDNGRGIKEHEKSGKRSLGILGIRERALLIGAEFEISSVEGEGTMVILRVPICRKAT